MDNLGPWCSDQELKDQFARFPTFNRLHLHNQGGTAIALVEYQDKSWANQAMMQLQGCVLPSSDRGGIRIQPLPNSWAPATHEWFIGGFCCKSPIAW